MDKITADDIMRWEKDALIDALGNCIELNDLFLERYCNQEFHDLMIDIPERDREFIISGIDLEAWFNGSPLYGINSHIWLNVAEIEFQFEGDPVDIFEDPDDLYITGDLAYLYVGYGLSIEFNLDQLIEAINDYNS